MMMQEPNRPHGSLWSPLVLLAVVALVLALRPSPMAATAEASPPTWPRPNCPNVCGNTNVSYPFGIGPDCFFPGFEVTCDRTHGLPRLLLGNGDAGMEVTDIFVENSTLRIVRGPVINQTSNSTMEAHRTWGEFLGRHGPFSLTYGHNQFIVMGCNIQGTLLGNGNLIADCLSFCPVDRHGNEVISEAENIMCSGSGRCIAPIPLLYEPPYEVGFKRLNTTCYLNRRLPLQSLLLIAEKDWFTTSNVWGHIYYSLTVGTFFQLPDLSRIPVSLEWAIDSTEIGEAHDDIFTCPTDEASACKSVNSACSERNNTLRAGYVCKCSSGYEGNPYVLDGCKDINECTDPEQYPCHGECHNLPGTYQCQCPRGSHGNPSIVDGCVKSTSSGGLYIGLGVGSGAALVSMLRQI
ncbi:hypothetical protein ACP4OV_027257 [Aristida adscensionis]